MEPSLIRAWEAVVHHRYDDSWSLGVVQERLDTAAIKSRGDAIPHLRLSGQVIRSVSLQQIQMEQKALEGRKDAVIIINDIFIRQSGEIKRSGDGGVQRGETEVLFSHDKTSLAGKRGGGYWGNCQPRALRAKSDNVAELLN